MLKVFFINLFFSYCLFADSSIRIANLKQFLNSLPNNELQKNLELVNFYYNQITSEYDKIDKNNSDQWETLVDFILKGEGDCEEYAISKYITLKTTNISKDKLFLMIVKEKTRPIGELHMVMVYYDESMNPLVLDNLSSKILPLSKRVDLIPILIFNEKEAYEYDKNKLTSNKISTNLIKKLSDIVQKSKQQFYQYNIY